MVVWSSMNIYDRTWKCVKMPKKKDWYLASKSTYKGQSLVLSLHSQQPGKCKPIIRQHSQNQQPTECNPLPFSTSHIYIFQSEHYHYQYMTVSIHLHTHTDSLYRPINFRIRLRNLPPPTSSEKEKYSSTVTLPLAKIGWSSISS